MPVRLWVSSKSAPLLRVATGSSRGGKYNYMSQLNVDYQPLHQLLLLDAQVSYGPFKMLVTTRTTKILTSVSLREFLNTQREIIDFIKDVYPIVRVRQVREQQKPTGNSTAHGCKQTGILESCYRGTQDDSHDSQWP